MEGWAACELLLIAHMKSSSEPLVGKTASPIMLPTTTKHLQMAVICSLADFSVAFFSCRAKYHRLKYGTDVSPEKAAKDEETVNQEAHKDAGTNNSKPGVSWRQGRQLLRQ